MSKSQRNSQSVNRLNKLKTINEESLEGPGNIDIAGLPSGGTTGQVLAKASDAEADTVWASVNGGGGVEQHNDLLGRSEANAHPASSISGLGTAATANVTTSPNDTTAGRLLKVGDFGIGSNGFRGYPVNDFNSPDNADVPVGIYSFNTTFDNRPVDTTGIMIVASRASGEKINILVTGGTSTPDMYFRRVTESSIGPWQKNYHTDNIVGTVSQANGVPTGAIIEQGSNADGDYTKYADGTLICRRRVDNIIIDTADGALYRSVEMNHDFPHEFVSTPSCSGSVGRTALRWCSVRGRAGLTQQWQHHQWGANSSTTERETFLLAVGRWYE